MIENNLAQDVVVAAKPGWRQPRLWGLLATVGFLVALGAGLWQWQRMLGADGTVNLADVRLATVERGDVRRTVVALGKMVVANSPTLYASAEGVVTYAVKAGDSVSKGQLLLEIESPTITNQLAQEKTTLSRLEADVTEAQNQARSQVFDASRAEQEAQLNLRASERAWARYQEGIKQNFVSQQEYERAEDELALNRLRVAQSQEKYRLAQLQAQSGVQSAKLLLERQQWVVDELQRRVEALKMVSPVDGMVGVLALNQKSAVAMYQALVTVVDLSRYEGEVMVAEHYARDLALGMPVDITLDNQQYPGAVAAIAPDIQGGQVQVRLRFTGEAPASLRQNQRISSILVLETQRQVLRLPRGVYLDADQGQSLFKVQGDLAQRVPVRLGVMSLEHVEVSSGLALGDQVIVSDTASYKNFNKLYLAQ